MSEAKYYQIRCDFVVDIQNNTRCRQTVVGAAFETPSRMRRKMKTKGWVQVAVPQTAWQKEHGVPSTAKWDRCPEHAPK